MIVFQFIAVPLVALFFLRCVYRLIRGDRPRWGLILGAMVWLVAAVSIGNPQIANQVARSLGIGRGADLVIYVLAIAFVTASLYFYQKYRHLEFEITQIVRSLAIQNALDRQPAAGSADEPADGRD